MQKRNMMIVWGVTLLTIAGGAGAEEIGFVEDFALAEDREAALNQLIPGTEQFYYYHCLHYQNRGELGNVDDILKTWIKRYKHTALVREIQNRQALLRYEQDPAGSLELIRQRLGLHFNHQRERLDAKPDHPTKLNQNLVSRRTLTAQALQRRGDLGGFEDRALDWLIAMDLNPDRRRHLLGRMQRPDYASLPRLVVDDLRYKHSRGFGSLDIHRMLLSIQLDQCLQLDPTLIDNLNFVTTYLSKLRPRPDDDWRHNPKVRRAYLDRLWNFARDLPPVHNSIKASILYRRLEFDRSQGKYDTARFMAYIKLPRRVAYIEPRHMKRNASRRYPVNLNADYSGHILMPPIRHDEPLVRSYLEHFFLEAESYKPYAPYIRESYLKRVFAETKILAGIGDMEQWYSMLTPSEYETLKRRVDLDFIHTNKKLFAADEPVTLDLAIKNAKTLIVKVFRINNLNFYLSTGRKVNTDINLDGLVTNSEKIYNYKQASLRRVARSFEFPGLTRRGVYVIEFIGGGRSSRALVRKGRLRYLERTSSAGHLFTIHDEQNRARPEATLYVAGHHYSPDEHGVITVPFTAKPARQPIILVDGDFATLDKFKHLSEQYRLTAGFHVQREQLLAHRKALLVVRPTLTINGEAAPIGLLEQIALTITATDHDGTATTTRVDDFKLHNYNETVHEFVVPDRLSLIAFNLTAKIKSLSQDKKINLDSGAQFSLNQIDKTEKTEDLHVLRDRDRYMLDLLGRTGEPVPDRPVNLVLKHRGFREQVHVTLKSDANGRVHLGPLHDIERLRATGPQGTSRTWRLHQDRCVLPSNVHGETGVAVKIPYVGRRQQPSRDELSLIETRGGAFVADRFDALAIKDGFIIIDNLPDGDYDLLFKDTGRRIAIRMTTGTHKDGHVLAKMRRLEVRNAEPLHISALNADKEKITIHVRHATPLARVHVLASRYVPAFDVYRDLGRVGVEEPNMFSSPRAESLYVAGRDIGDEYRYILDRKYAAKFPGNTLKRPELLLNPWAIRKTQAGHQVARTGEDYKRKGEAGEHEFDIASPLKAETGPTSDFANLDFLANRGVLLANLAPDENGIITIKRAVLGNRHHLHIVAVDPHTTVVRQIAMAEAAPRFLDLRLADGLDPALHFSEQKRISVLEKGKSFVIPDVRSSRFEVYDSIAKVYRLYTTLGNNANLSEFRFILDWPKLKDADKREKYSKYACHELNFFLYEKDRPFFDKVIKPYLANKRGKTFIDHWLLGADMSPYLQAWPYQRLNIVERALIGRRIAGDRRRTASHVTDLYNLLPPDVERFNFLFRTALKGSSLETAGTIGDGTPADQIRRLRSLGYGGKGKGGKPAPGAAATRAMNGAVLHRRDDLAKEQMQPSAERPDDHLGAKDEFTNGRLARDRTRRATARQLYRKLDKTQEWAENNYYHLPIDQQNAALVPVSAFWRDYANHGGKTPFLSTNLAEASRNFTEMMFALAVLDLPFEAGKHDRELKDRLYSLTAASPAVIYHQQIRPTNTTGEKTPILISQNFFRHGDRYRHLNNEKLDKFITDEFLAHTVYGCQVVATNPTSSRQKLDLLLQVPRGAIPVLNGKYTRGVHVDLQPYHTKTIEYYFYFPFTTGDDEKTFAHYPVHVAREGSLIAFAKAIRFNVVEKPSKIDKQSWDYISQHGSQDNVLKFLGTHNPGRIKLNRIAWRMQNKIFFRAVVELLDQRHIYDNTLWSYAMKHNHLPALRQFLRHADRFVSRCGSYIDCKLLTIDPVVRKTYQHMEYSPLVNARAHQLGRAQQILNDRFGAQYHRLMKTLTYRPKLDDDDLMAVTYYLLLQDRTEQGMAFFERVNPDKLATRLQHDYITAYLDFFTDGTSTARRIASRYKNHPIDLWRQRFAKVLVRIDQIEGKSDRTVDPGDRTQVQARLASTEPGFEFNIDTRHVTLNYQNVNKCRVNYYLMDIELLFSRQPFVQQYSSHFSFVQPNQTSTINLPPTKKTYRFALPAELANRNVMVEITGGGVTKSQTYFSNALTVQVIENYGQVRVARRRNDKGYPKVYVKVYARMKNGQVRFYKDGYTDLRGRFDYTSLNTNELDLVDRFSLLILSETDGAVVREAGPPKR